MTKKKLLFLISLFVSSIVLGQTKALPDDHPIAKAAPHLPLMVRYKGSGNAFHGEKYVYQKEENESKIREWIKRYPSEFTQYTGVISSFFKEKEIHNDLMSQWIMIRQLK
jgi:hypothetical protein